MNISDYVKPAMHAIVAKKDGEIKGALDDFCPGWTLVDVERRCQIIRVWNSPVETLYMDGVPILEIHRWSSPNWCLRAIATSSTSRRTSAALLSVDQQHLCRYCAEPV
jgi:hypothetical protein